MAVLKDLIVHGPSKFIGKTQFNTINARSIGAKEGIFEKLIATTLNAETATIDDLTAQNATVVGLLDVQGELHTNAWTNANIANIGGSFYISPSVETVSGTITINKNASNWTVQITGNFATDFIKTAGATTASAWPVDSLVLVTGNIVVNNMDYPLGTLKGKLTAQVAASAATTSKTITMSCASTYVDNPNADVLQMLYEANGNANITNAAFSNGKISMYKISGTKPIGILMSSVGITAKGSNYIDIYGGTNNDGTPNLRIGHLTGLPVISLNGKSMTPTGWGLYADNAYLSGTIHSAAGIIGGFTIDSNSIHNGTLGTANSVLVSTGTSSAANIGGSGSISGWAFTAGTTYGVTKAGALYATSGSIAGWNFNGTSLYKNSATPGASASAMVISTGTASTNNIGGGGTASKTWMLSAGTGFGVTTSGVLYATGAQISGAITATSGSIANSVTIGGTAASTVLSNISTAQSTANTAKTNAATAQTTANNAATAASNAAKTATTYITDIDSNLGITVKPATKTGNDYLQMNSTDIRFVRNNVDVMNLTDSAFRIGTASSGHSTVKSDGLHVWTGTESTATNEVAFFGTTARIGANNSSRFLLNTNSIQGYGVGDNNTIVKYFEITQDGIYFGADGIEGATADSINGIMEQLTIRTDDLETTINKHITQINSINTLLADYSTIKSTVNTYLGNGKILYNSGANLTLKSTNFSIATTSSTMSFKQGNTTVGSISNSKFNVPDMIINSSEQLGTKFKWVITTNRISLMRI